MATTFDRKTNTLVWGEQTITLDPDSSPLDELIVDTVREFNNLDRMVRDQAARHARDFAEIADGRMASLPNTNLIGEYVGKRATTAQHVSALLFARQHPNA